MMNRQSQTIIEDCQINVPLTIMKCHQVKAPAVTIIQTKTFAALYKLHAITFSNNTIQ